METHPSEQIFQSIHWWLIDLEGMKLSKRLQIQTEDTASCGISRLQWEETG